MEDDKDRRKKERSIVKLSLGDLLIPVVSGVIFVLIVFFILLPSINNSQDMLSEIEDVKADQEIIERNLDVIKSLDFEELQGDLSNARRVLPRRLEVAQFAYYVDSLAREKGLDFRELKAGDVTISEEEVKTLDVKGIRVPMGYSGDYEPILDFFNELQVVSPYVISFGHKVELNKRGVEDEGPVVWSLSIDITGYHVEEDSSLDVTPNPLLPFIAYDTDPDIVAEFAERVERLVLVDR